MADVDITSLSVEISADCSDAVLNIDKLAAAISNLLTKGNIEKTVNGLNRLSAAILALKQASYGLSGLDRLTSFLDSLSKLDVSGAVKNLNSVVSAIKKIPSAISALDGVDFYSLSRKIEALVSALAPLSKLDVSGLKALSSAINALKKIPDLAKDLKSADLDAFAAACKKISEALSSVSAQLEKVGNAFSKLPSWMSKVVTQANRIISSNQKVSKSYTGLSGQIDGFIKRAAKLVSLKAIADYIGNAVVKFNDFYEATDLFNNAMGNLSDEASSLVNKMQELLGIDPKDAMEHIATIQSLATSFGLASDKAYILSKNLTQLAYDEASYWNKDSAETFTAISSAISGELEPIRRLGVDLSQARLQQELLALGFNKQVSSLSQADKAVLRYIAIMKQTANIQGNLAQTITSPANQIRMLKAELEQLAKSVGSLLYPAFSSILPPLIAAVELIKEFVQWVAKLVGINIQFTDFSKAKSDVGGVSDALDNATNSTKKAAKALKDYTMGFDELNIIDPTQSSSGNSGSGSGASGNILGDVDLSGYDMFKDYVSTSVDEIKKKLESLLPVIGSIGAGFLAWEISKGLISALERLSELTVGIGNGWSTLGITMFIADMNEFRKYLEDFMKNGATFQNVVGMVSEFAGMMGDALAILGKLKWAGALKCVQGIGEIVIAVKDIYENGINWDNGTTLFRGLTNLAAGIGLFTGNLKLAGWSIALQGFSQIIKQLHDNWDAIKNGDWSGIDKATMVVSVLEVLGGIATALGVFSKIKEAKDSAEAVKSARAVAKSVEGVNGATSGLSSSLGDLVKNLGLGVAIIGEVAAAAVLFAGAVVVLGKELSAVGDAWQPVIDNAGTVAAAVATGTGLLVAVGVAAYALGTGGASIAANIGIGVAILAEIGLAAAAFEADIWVVGKGLTEIDKAWQPIINNSSAVEDAIVDGTLFLIAVAAACAALGTATVLTFGLLPAAIGVGTAVLVECAAAFVAFTKSLVSVADELSQKLSPALSRMNKKLPTMKTDMEDFTSYLEDFAGEISSYTSSMGSVTWSSLVNGFIGIFSGNPIASLADDIDKTYKDSSDLNRKLNLANPELELAVKLLSNYVDLMNQLKVLTDENGNVKLSTGLFTNLEDAGKKLVTGFVSGIDSKLNALQNKIAEVVSIVESLGDKRNVKAIETAGKNLMAGFIKGINGQSDAVYTAVSSIGQTALEKLKKALDEHSPSKKTEQFGIWLDQGLANGINAALGYVEKALNGLSNLVQEKSNEFIDAGAESASNYINGFISGLDSNTASFKSSLQNDLFGTIKSLAEAFKSGDGKTIGSAIVAVVWDAMGEENRSEVKTFASDLLSNLTSSLKKVANKALKSASLIGQNIWSGVTSHFNDIVKSVGDVGTRIYNSFSALSGPLSSAASKISSGLLGGLVSKFPEILTGVAGVISTIGGAFMGILSSIGSVLSSLGIPTGVVMIAGGIAIAAAVAGIVASLGASRSSSDSYNYDSSSYPGTSSYDKTYGSGSYSGISYSGNSGTSSEEMRSAVYNGCYNAFLDIWQRYSDQIKDGQNVTVVIDSKKLVSSVEKQQADRGMQIMGSEVYSY